MMRHQAEEEQQWRVLYELSALILDIIRSPPSRAGRRGRTPEMTPAGFASLLLGISLAMMFCGSVTFFIGFLLMPWVIGLVMVLYVVGIVSSLSMLGRALLCHFSTPASPSSPKDPPSWKLLSSN